MAKPSWLARSEIQFVVEVFTMELFFAAVVPLRVGTLIQHGKYYSDG